MASTIRLKAIVPKALNTPAMRNALEAEMQAVQKEVRRDFDATTRTWSNKPGFKDEFQSRPNRLRFFTGTSDEVYTYVSEGTKAHVIRPKRAKMLRFQGTYSAKTSPGVIGSSSGGSSGPVVYSTGVRHPGTKARKFDEAIKKRWQSPFEKRMRQAMDRAAKASGHSR